MKLTTKMVMVRAELRKASAMLREVGARLTDRERDEIHEEVRRIDESAARIEATLVFASQKIDEERERSRRIAAEAHALSERAIGSVTEAAARRRSG